MAETTNFAVIAGWKMGLLQGWLVILYTLYIYIYINHSVPWTNELDQGKGAINIDFLDRYISVGPLLCNELDVHGSMQGTAGHMMYTIDQYEWEHA